MEIDFGGMAPTIREQIDNISDKDAEILQGHSTAIVRLAVHGLLTEAEVHKARLRLAKKITAAARWYSKETPNETD